MKQIYTLESNAELCEGGGRKKRGGVGERAEEGERIEEEQRMTGGEKRRKIGWVEGV